MVLTTFDPHGATPVRSGTLATTLAKLPYWHGQYTFAEAGSCCTVDDDLAFVPLGSVVHRETDRDHDDAIVIYWIQTPGDDVVMGRTLSNFPRYRDRR